MNRITGLSKSNIMKKVFITMCISLLMPLSLQAEVGEIFTAVNEDGIEMQYVIISENCVELEYVFKQEDPQTGQYCYSKDHLTIPSEVNGYKVTMIGGNFLSPNNDIKSVTIPESVTILEDNIFMYCEALESIFIPKSVEYIGGFPFSNCYALKSIVVDEDNLFYDSRDNCNALIRKEDGTLMKGCDNSFIPNGVKHIGATAFKDCLNLNHLTIPEGVESLEEACFWGSMIESIDIPASVLAIGTYAFWHSKLSTITFAENSQLREIRTQAFLSTNLQGDLNLPNSVSYIGAEAFRVCGSLKSVRLPESLKSIGKGAFSDCNSLECVIIPTSVKEYGVETFWDCKGIKDIYSYNSNPAPLDVSVFDFSAWNHQNHYEDATLYVPKGSIDNYQSTDGWKQFKHIVEMEGMGIKSVTDTGVSSESTYYDLSGVLSAPCVKGIRVLKMKDGRVKKVITK
jgi:hypothetical protein